MANLTSEPATDEASDLGITIRKATAVEIDKFVIPSWTQSYTRSLVGKLARADGRFSSGRERYWHGMQARTSRIIETATTRVQVADVGGEAVAWAADDISERTLHYVYVKDTFRRQGFARQLAGWILDGRQGNVYLNHLPPKWFTAPDPDTGRMIWPPHVVIDLISPL